jgi:putative ABC transport system permease protein
MTAVADLVEVAPAGDTASGTGGRGTGARLLRFAVANVGRRPERAVLAVAGIALAVTSVVVVRTIAASYQATGGDAVADAIGDAPFWVVPEAGVRLDAELGVVVTDGAAPDVAAPAGWTMDTVLVGRLPGAADVALVGRSADDAGGAGSAEGGTDGGADRPAAGEALATPAALDRLGLADGDPLDVGGRTVVVRRAAGAGAAVTVSLYAAATAGVETGWATLLPPPGDVVTADDVATATGLDVVTDPSRAPPSGSGGLVYAVDQSAGRAGIVSFQQKMAALLGGQVTSSTLGLVSQIGLVLGFVIAVSTFVAATQERRREFGIMASVGLTDEVLYFFLVESLLLFVVAYLVGVVAGGLLVMTLLPSFFSAGSWLSAAGMVAMYLPALGVVAALVPVHRLLQQRPVALLADDP